MEAKVPSRALPVVNLPQPPPLPQDSPYCAYHPGTRPHRANRIVCLTEESAKLTKAWQGLSAEGALRLSSIGGGRERGARPPCPPFLAS